MHLDSNPTDRLPTIPGPPPTQAKPQGAACITHRGPKKSTTITSYAALARATADITRALLQSQSHQIPPTAATRPEPQQQQERPRIALLCRNHELALAYLFAATDAGWVAAPLNTRWVAPEAAAALADCGQGHAWGW